MAYFRQLTEREMKRLDGTLNEEPAPPVAQIVQLPVAKTEEQRIKALSREEQERILDNFHAKASERLIAATCLGYKVIKEGHTFVSVRHPRTGVGIRIPK